MDFFTGGKGIAGFFSPSFAFALLSMSAQIFLSCCSFLVRRSSLGKGLAKLSLATCGEYYGVDTTSIQKLLPAESNPTFLNSTQLAEKLGILTKSK